jgi:DNA-directed RNA polymerase specialized sigma24 family protein
MKNPCKDILFSYYFSWEKKKIGEIAQEMDKSPDVVKTTKSRCMKDLTVYLTEKLKEAKLI